MRICWVWPFTKTQFWLRSTHAFRHGLRRITTNTFSLCLSRREALALACERKIDVGESQPESCIPYLLRSVSTSLRHVASEFSVEESGSKAEMVGEGVGGRSRRSEEH